MKTPEDILNFTIKVCGDLRQEKFTNTEAVMVAKLILITLQGDLN